MERCIRRKKIDFQYAFSFVMSGEKVKAKHEIEKCLSGITSATGSASMAILHEMENTQLIPDNERLLSIIEEKEIIQAKAKMNVETIRSKNKAAIKNKENDKAAAIPHCPTCGSTDITKQGIIGRAVTSALIGGFAPESRAQFRCNKCGYMW